MQILKPDKFLQVSYSAPQCLFPPTQLIHPVESSDPHSTSELPQQQPVQISYCWSSRIHTDPALSHDTELKHHQQN